MSGAPAKDALANVAAPAAATRDGVSPGGEPHARAPAKAPSNDVVLLGPPTADGAGVHVIRAREERLEAGELRALQEGRPITGEVVTLAPRQGNPRVCDVKDSWSPPSHRPPPHKGPATVATDAYRDGWDEVFGKNRSSPSSSSAN